MNTEETQKAEEDKENTDTARTMSALMFFCSDSVLKVNVLKLSKPDSKSSVELRKDTIGLIEASRKQSGVDASASFTGE